MLGPYTRPGLPNFIDSPAGRRLVELVDPYAYRDRLAMPKLIVLGTNDRYWPLDALNLYWSGLSGPKNVLYVPNAGHDLDDEARWQSSLLCFFHAVAQKQALPTVQASVRPLDGRLQASARAEAPALQARLWFAQAPTRDFREAVWSCIPMRRAGATWMADIARAPQDYAATFAALRFDLAGEACSLSSPAQIHDPQTR
jgi:PhoPQ-activated pathogenicity-related protein